MSFITQQLLMALLGVLVSFTVISTITPNQVSPQQNNAIEISTETASSTSMMRQKLVTTNVRETRCLAENIYYEAGNQSYAGKLAVGFVVLNRMSHPLFPKSVCGVTYQAVDDICQFSWVCDPNRAIINERAISWIVSLKIAKFLLSTEKSVLDDITEGALYFHNHTVSPQWSAKRTRTVEIDDHIFYR